MLVFLIVVERVLGVPFDGVGALVVAPHSARVGFAHVFCVFAGDDVVGASGD